MLTVSKYVALFSKSIGVLFWAATILLLVESTVLMFVNPAAVELSMAKNLMYLRKERQTRVKKDNQLLERLSLIY